MYPYYMRDELQPRKDLVEVVAAIAAMVVLVACTMSNGPRLNSTTVAAEAQERDQQAIAELQTMVHQLQLRNEASETQQVKTARLLQTTQSDVARLTQGHDTLSTQIAGTTAKMQQLETAVQQTTERMAKLGDSGVLQKISQERDDALARTKQKDDQVRQLTLKLQKAGIYP